MSESNNNSKAIIPEKDLSAAYRDLSLDNSTEGFNRILDEYPDLGFNEAGNVRSKIITAMGNKKNGHQLKGAAREAHVKTDKCTALIGRINELIDEKTEKTDPFTEDARHQERLVIRAKRKNKRGKKAGRNYQRPPLKAVKPVEVKRIDGKLRNYPYKGIDVLVVEGFAKKEIVTRDEKGKIVYEKDEDDKFVLDESGEKKKVMEKKKLIQVITMQGGELKGVSIGCVYEVDKLPKQLRFVIFPEQQASYLAELRRAEEEKKTLKKQQANPNKQKEKEKKAKEKKMSKEEKKQARKNAA